jgi:hypothetical protein
LFARGGVEHVLEVEFEDGSLLGNGDGCADALGDFAHDGVDNEIHATGDPDAVLEWEEVLGKAGGVDPREVTSQLTSFTVTSSERAKFLGVVVVVFVECEEVIGDKGFAEFGREEVAEDEGVKVAQEVEAGEGRIAGRGAVGDVDE